MLNPTDKANLDAILAKSPLELTEEEAAVLRARESYLTEEQKKNFADHLTAPAPAEEGEEKPKKGK